METKEYREEVFRKVVELVIEGALVKEVTFEQFFSLFLSCGQAMETHIFEEYIVFTTKNEDEKTVLSHVNIVTKKFYISSTVSSEELEKISLDPFTYLNPDIKLFNKER